MSKTEQAAFHFDKRTLFDAEIEPLLGKLYELCQRHGFPMLAMVQFSSMPNEDGVACQTVLSDAKGVPLDASTHLLALSSFSNLIMKCNAGDPRAKIAMLCGPPVLVEAAHSHRREVQEELIGRAKAH